jgi:hypothetical protein
MGIHLAAKGFDIESLAHLTSISPTQNPTHVQIRLNSREIIEELPVSDCDDLPATN